MKRGVYIETSVISSLTVSRHGERAIVETVVGCAGGEVLDQAFSGAQAAGVVVAGIRLFEHAQDRVAGGDPDLPRRQDIAGTWADISMRLTGPVDRFRGQGAGLASASPY